MMKPKLTQYGVILILLGLNLCLLTHPLFNLIVPPKTDASQPAQLLLSLHVYPYHPCYTSKSNLIFSLNDCLISSASSEYNF